MDYLSVTNAQACVLGAVRVLGTEHVRLEKSLGRVLAEDMVANRDLPPVAVSAMDGYAVCSRDLAGIPSVLEIIEDIKAGDTPFRTIGIGQCARIMTGAPVPAGADAVLRVEDTVGLTSRSVQINVRVKPGNDIRSQGESMRRGEVVLGAGIEITPGVVGVLASVKSAQVRVFRQPRVAILSTGNELERIQDPIDPNKIPDSNSYALMAQVQELGIEPVLLGIARDDPDDLRSLLLQGMGFDVLMVSGGSSVGIYDYVRPVIEAMGVRVSFWRVAMRPGHPVAFGVRESHPQASGQDTLVFGLPGNPVSSMVCFEQFVGPALRSMMGHVRLFRRTVTACLTHDLKHQPGRTEFVRVNVEKSGSSHLATSTGSQGSGMMLSMAKADGLLVVPAATATLFQGQTVTVQLLGGMAFQQERGFDE